MQRTCWAEFQRQNRASKKLPRCKQMRNLTTSGTGSALSSYRVLGLGVS
ncbi:unnamed protein product [Prunus brigantina]